MASDETKIKIKMTPSPVDPEGTVMLNAIVGDDGWYEDLQSVIGGMVECSTVDIVDYTGTCIKTYDSKKLCGVGELDIVNTRTGKIIRVPNVVKPPLRMSANKPLCISNWYKNKRRSICNAVIDNIECNSLGGISGALQTKGTVFKAICSEIKSDNWKDFSADVARTQAVRGLGANAIAERVASLLWGGIRAEMKSHQSEITAHVSNMDSMWKTDKKINESKFENKEKLFLHIVNNAVYDDALIRHVCVAINIGEGVANKARKPIKPVKNAAKIDAAFRMFSGRHQLKVDRPMPVLVKVGIDRPMPGLVKVGNLIPICNKPLPPALERNRTCSTSVSSSKWVDDLPSLTGY